MSRSRHVVVACCALALTGCGPSGHGADTDPEKGSDAEVLNDALARELTGLDFYVRRLPQLAGGSRALGRRLRSQQQEYVDALTKAIRGVGGDVDVDAEVPPSPESNRPDDVLRTALELEATAMTEYLDAEPRLFTAAPRTLAAAIAAGHAQHLVVLRQALGANRVDAIPLGFDDGEAPARAVPPAGEG